MFCINVQLAANDAADVPKIREWLSKGASLSRAEPGCLRFDVYHSETDPSVFILNEHWESKQAWEVHRGAEAVTTIYAPLVLPRVTRTAHFCTLVDVPA